jgi:hypothetical protein
MHAIAVGTTPTVSDNGGVPLWVPVLTLVVGAAVPVLVEYIRTFSARADRTQAAAERRAERDHDLKAREEERRQNLTDKRQAYQRDTLTELQEQLSSLTRITGKAHHADRAAWKAASRPTTYPVSLLPPGVSDEFNVVQRRVLILSERVDEAVIRDGVRSLLQAIGNAVPLPGVSTAAEADTALLQAVERFRSLNETIGSTLRSLPASS